MKKIIALMLVLVMVFSLVGCKSKSNTDDQEIAIAGGEGEKTVEEQQEQTPTENTEQSQEAQTPTENTEQKQEVQTPAEDTQKQEPAENTSKQEQTDTEAQKPVEQTPTAALKYPELQALNQQLQKEFGLEGKGYPTDVYLQEYLPLKKGYVTKQTNDGSTYYYNAKKDFVTKEPITEQMIEAAKAYPYRKNGISGVFNANNCRLQNSIPSQDGFYIVNRADYDNILSFMEAWVGKEAFIVKGHFEQSYGTAYAYYNAETDIAFSENYTVNKFTLHNFVIEKVYTDNCEYKAGDVIEVGIGGTILQAPDGFYRADLSSETGAYVNFKNASLEQRTFILSVKPKNKEGKYSDIMRIGNICQNVYENVDYGDVDKNTLAREILAKYK